MAFEVLTKNEAAERARISRRHLENEIRAGRGPTVTRIGAAVRIRSDVFEDWLRSCTVQPLQRPVEAIPCLTQLGSP